LVVISNMKGQIVYRNEVAPGQSFIQKKINMSNLSGGTYVVTVYFSNQEKRTVKVVKL
jgi:hypothetical protein